MRAVAVAVDRKLATRKPGLSRLRSTEFSRLDRYNELYLDCTGSTLYAESHVAGLDAAQRDGAFSIDEFARCMNQRPVGAVRMSLGLANNEADVRRGVEVVAAWRDQNFTAKAT